MGEDARGGKRWLDAAGCAILEKHRARLSRGYAATDSDVIRDLDARYEELAALLRERARRVTVR